MAAILAEASIPSADYHHLEAKWRGFWRNSHDVVMQYINSL